MNIFTKAKDAYKAWTLLKTIQEDKMDFKSLAGWIKIIGYLGALAGIVVGYLDTKTVVEITIGLSAAIKFAEYIVSKTKNTADDQIVAAVKNEATEHGLMK